MGYALLAHCFASPDAAAIERIRDIGASSQSALGSSVLAPLAAAAAGATREDLEEQYASLFTLSSSPDCPTFETAFISTDHLQQTNRMADIAGFYRAFGVDTGGNGFRPDELSVELEFVAFLCQKQAYAAEHLGAPRVKQTLRAERLFLREHLARWGGPLGRRVAMRASGHAFYAALGSALHDWLDEECSRLAVGPVEMVDEPRMEWEDPNAASASEDEPFSDPVSVAAI